MILIQNYKNGIQVKTDSLKVWKDTSWLFHATKDSVKKDLEWQQSGQ